MRAAPWALTLGALVVGGCSQQQPTAPVANNAQQERDLHNEPTLATSHASSHRRIVDLEFVVPKDVASIFKMKCHICHGGTETEGGFDLKKMIYQPDPDTDWRPMDLAAATRIKLAILPIDGKPARMPKKFGSTWHPLSEDETNLVAKWTDYPFARNE